MSKKSLLLFLTLTAAFLCCLLLLAGCGNAKTEPALTPVPAEPDAEGSYFATSDGYWTTDGNAWYAPDGGFAWFATYGDAWWNEEYEDAWYATDGDSVSSPYIAYATDGNAVPGSTVRVSTVDELLEAIAPDTEILLAPGTYDLNSASPALYRYCYWKPLSYCEGSQLILCNLSNTVIRSESGDCADVTITAGPAEANVLTFEDCYQVRLSGVTMGHKEPGAICSGSVIYINRSVGVYIGGCDLYGCGYMGVQGNNASAVTVENCLIHDCSGSGVDFYDCQSVFVNGSTFTNSGEYQTLSFMLCEWALVNECTFTGNQSYSFLNSYNSYNVSLVRCRMDHCNYGTLYDVDGGSVQQNGLTVGDGVFLGGTRYYG